MKLYMGTYYKKDHYFQKRIVFSENEGIFLVKTVFFGEIEAILKVALNKLESFFRNFWQFYKINSK